MGSIPPSELRVPSNPGERAINDYRPIKAICIGAGMSGITAGCMLPQKIPNLELVIYEKNDDVGGGWYENHYPGVQPDLTPHTYQYTFASNPRWSRFYPPGREFEHYLKVVAKRFGVYDRTKFRHKFLTARWIEDDGQWEVEVLRLDDNVVSQINLQDRAEVLIRCMGLVNDWRFPDIPGRQDYQGKMIHTARWDDSYDVTGKRVAVIGYGATGVQIMPAIQPLVKSVDHYVRGPFWIAPAGGTAMEEILERGERLNFDHPAEEIEKFSEKPLTYLTYRKKIEHLCNGYQAGLMRDTEAHAQLHAIIEANMKATLAPKEGYFELLKPEYEVGCRRLVMGQRWMEALVQPNATLFKCDIARFTKEGIEHPDGTIREYDAIICATGFDTKLDNANTPILGQGGITLAEQWDPEPVAYLSVAVPKFPNMFQLFGPNSAPVAGSICHTMEGACGFVIKSILKLQQEYLKSIVVSPRAAQDWMNQVDYWTSKTVISGTCRTWFKRNIEKGRSIINWPGSAMHAYRAWSNPRWEDFEYESWLPEGQSLRWMGNGMTYSEQHGTDTTDYMSFTDEATVLTEEDFKAVEDKLTK
ncbi:FAD/NAD(P)-binding domain-containing protein [Lophium mytilinum]|uniref:FAD/NAD(P)-binding domain-containing protein n=1 Tax=Lophium mytilinum TaxID=390894 RepID=A0A6A6R8T6_9PEZI|nr:FAD/NAD(P)-binding domain-containing protein [Lophium mytilinum]